MIWCVAALLLAQEILTQPAVLYCDEPTTGLETGLQGCCGFFDLLE